MVAAGPIDHRMITLDYILNIEQVSFLPFPPVDFREGFIGTLTYGILEWLVGE